MRLGPSNLGGLSSLQTNSPSTNPTAKIVRFCESANALLKKSAGFAGKGEQFVAVILVLLLPGLDFCGEAVGEISSQRLKMVKNCNDSLLFF